MVWQDLASFGKRWQGFSWAILHWCDFPGFGWFGEGIGTMWPILVGRPTAEPGLISLGRLGDPL
jgi:hypothetical protein